MGIQELEAAMSSLFDLVDSAEQKERPYQDWLEQHEIVLRLLGYVRILPHPALVTQRGDGTDEEFIPDFMGQLANGLWEIIEIKRPDTPVLPPGERRREFYAPFRKYISQCRDYSRYFEDSANRKAFETRYQTTIQHTKVRSILIAGWSDEDRAQVHDLIVDERLLQFLTYHELFTKIETAWRVSEGENEGLPGISFVMQIALTRHARPKERLWIADFGVKEDRDRISFFLGDDGAMHVHILDDGGVLNRMRVEIGDALGQQVYLGFELGLHARFTVGRVWIDDRVETAKWPAFRFPMPDGLCFTLGSDMTGEGKGEFYLGSTAVYDAVIPLEDRLQIRRAMRDARSGPWLRFYEGALMHNEGHPRFPRFQQVLVAGQSVTVPLRLPLSPKLTAGDVGRGPIFAGVLPPHMQRG